MTTPTRDRPSQRLGHDRPRILVLMPRGETFRTFVYTGILDRLAEFADVEIATVIPSPELLELLEDAHGPVQELEAIRDPWRVRIIRELLDTAHGRALWSEASQERWRRRTAEATDPASRLKLAGRAPWPGPSPTNGVCSGSAGPTTGAPLGGVRRPRRCGPCRDDPPDLVLNTSHVHSAIATPWLQAARDAGSRTAAFLFSWDNLTSQGRIIPGYDDYLVWSDAIADDLLRIYPEIAPEQVHVTGTPQFDPHFDPELAVDRNVLCDWIGADPARPIVLYTTGMPNHMPDEPWIVEDLADRLPALGLETQPQLVVRVYAKDRTGRFDELRDRRSDILFAPVHWEPNWLTPLPEDTRLWVNLLRHTDVGVNVASTVSLELCMFDKPVINVAYNPPSVPTDEIDYRRYYSFDHYRPVVESGAVASRRDARSTLSAALRHALCDPMDARQSAP